MVTKRLGLSRAIARYKGLATQCDRIDAEIAAREAAALKAASAARAEATRALERARRVNVSREKLALQAVLQTAERPELTVDEAEAALLEVQAKHDAEWELIDRAKNEAQRLRNADLRAAERARDDALGAVLAAEGVITGLLRRYQDARRELSRLYLGILALPVTIRPTGLWETPVSLNDLQTGDRSLADEIRDFIAALQIDPEAPLPGAPAPEPPEPEAEAAE